MPAWLSDMNWTLIFGVAFAISEALDAIPSLQSSSIWKMVYGWIKWAHDKVSPASKE